MTIGISELTPRHDFKEAKSAIDEVNKIIRAFCRTRDWKVIPHHTLNDQCLTSRGLHLNRKGSALLAKDFNSYIQTK